MLGGLLTWLLGGSLIAMVLGSVVAGNFWTYPLIFIGTYKLGKFFLGETPHLAESRTHVLFSWKFLLSRPTEYLLPMLLGSLPLAVLAWTASFWFVRRVVRGYKDARHKRIHHGT
jgi:uncharacterized protein (DUF2062 family)